MASKKQDAQRRQARCIFAYHEAACKCEGVSVVSQPALLAPRGVPRTLAHRPDTRAPGVFGAPRVRSASPLRVFLYAFWSRRSRLASARGGNTQLVSACPAAVRDKEPPLTSLLHFVEETPVISPL